MPPNQPQSIAMFVCGDVMTGRGVDQVLPHPGLPVLYESHIRDACDYVRLAEKASGPIARPVDFGHIWGDALEELHRADVRIVNLETCITSSDAAWPAKEVLYRMSPRNIDCLTTARIDCCCLANNHVLDWGYAGLSETIDSLDRAGIPHAGAGVNAARAAAPAVLDIPGKGRVLVFSIGSTTSGIPHAWGATCDRPGVHLLDDFSEQSVRRIGGQVREAKRPGDVVVASIHWGGNWGYAVPAEQIHFARGLIDEGVDLVHGHSSHHPKSLEVYRDHLILYGCGDFVDDYEGIRGYEEFRDELRLAVTLEVDPKHGQLVEARLVSLQVSRMRLERASDADASWLCDLLNRVCAPFGTEVKMQPDNSLLLHW